MTDHEELLKAAGIVSPTEKLDASKLLEAHEQRVADGLANLPEQYLAAALREAEADLATYRTWPEKLHDAFGDDGDPGETYWDGIRRLRADLDAANRARIEALAEIRQASADLDAERAAHRATKMELARYG